MASIAPNLSADLGIPLRVLAALLLIRPYTNLTAELCNLSIKTVLPRDNIPPKTGVPMDEIREIGYH
ncbi:hypothetical protein J6590_024295 [Homalodisca vitripennis]|nr:hypothetical protein J6590_024295 [Homalodisca vitripennis]